MDRLTSQEEQLVTEHLELVYAIAGKMRGWGESYDERVQDGTLGLIRGIRAWRFGGGAGPRTYFGHCITGEIMEGVRRRSGSRRHVRAELVSLYRPLAGGTDEDRTIGDTLVDGDPGPEEQVVGADRDEQVREKLERLFTSEERPFIDALAGEKGSKSQLARDLGCSEANVTCRIRVLRKRLEPLLRDLAAA